MHSSHQIAAVLGGLLMNQQACDIAAGWVEWPCARSRTDLIHFNASGDAHRPCHLLTMSLPNWVLPSGNQLQISCRWHVWGVWEYVCTRVHAYTQHMVFYRYLASSLAPVRMKGMAEAEVTSHLEKPVESVRQASKRKRSVWSARRLWWTLTWSSGKRFRGQVVTTEVGMRHWEALWVGKEACVEDTVWSVWSWELAAAVIA